MQAMRGCHRRAQPPQLHLGVAKRSQQTQLGHDHSGRFPAGGIVEHSVGQFKSDLKAPGFFPKIVHPFPARSVAARRYCSAISAMAATEASGKKCGGVQGDRELWAAIQSSRRSRCPLIRKE